LWQTFIASIAGTTASIVVASPFDVIKTRLQNRPFGDKITAYEVFLGTKQEGITAFFKGLTPKFISVGPKLVFSFTLAQYLIVQLDIIMRGYDPLSTDFKPNVTRSLNPMITVQSQGLSASEMVPSNTVKGN